MAAYPFIDGVRDWQHIGCVVEHHQGRSSYTGPTRGRHGNRLSTECLDVRRMVSRNAQYVSVQCVNRVEYASLGKLLPATIHLQPVAMLDCVQILS